MDNITKYRLPFKPLSDVSATVRSFAKSHFFQAIASADTHEAVRRSSALFLLPVWALRKVIMGNGGSPGSRGLQYEIIMNPRGYRGLTAHKRDLLSGQVCNCLCPSANKSWSFSVTRWTKGQGRGNHFNYNMTFHIFVSNVFIILLSLQLRGSTSIMRRICSKQSALSLTSPWYSVRKNRFTSRRFDGSRPICDNPPGRGCRTATFWKSLSLVN